MSTESAELWAAARTVEMHAPGLAGCAQCPAEGPDACDRLRQADEQLRAWEQSTGRQRPAAAPAWRGGA